MDINVKVLCFPFDRIQWFLGFEFSFNFVTFWAYLSLCFSCIHCYLKFNLCCYTLVLMRFPPPLAVWACSYCRSRARIKDKGCSRLAVTVKFVNSWWILIIQISLGLLKDSESAAQKEENEQNWKGRQEGNHRSNEKSDDVDLPLSKQVLRAGRQQIQKNKSEHKFMYKNY